MLQAEQWSGPCVFPPRDVLRGGGSDEGRPPKPSRSRRRADRRLKLATCRQAVWDLYTLTPPWWGSPWEVHTEDGQWRPPEWIEPDVSPLVATAGQGQRHERATSSCEKDGQWLPAVETTSSCEKDGQWQLQEGAGCTRVNDGQWQVREEGGEAGHTRDQPQLGNICAIYTLKHSTSFPLVATAGPENRNGEKTGEAKVEKDGQWQRQERVTSSGEKGEQWLLREAVGACEKGRQWQLTADATSSCEKDGQWRLREAVGTCEEGWQWQPTADATSSCEKGGQWLLREAVGACEKGWQWRPTADATSSCEKGGQWLLREAVGACEKGGQWKPTADATSLCEKDGQWQLWDGSGGAREKGGQWQPAADATSSCEKDGQWQLGDGSGCAREKDGRWQVREEAGGVAEPPRDQLQFGNQRGTSMAMWKSRAEIAKVWLADGDKTIKPDIINYSAGNSACEKLQRNTKARNNTNDISYSIESGAETVTCSAREQSRAASHHEKWLAKRFGRKAKLEPNSYLASYSDVGAKTRVVRAQPTLEEWIYGPGG